MSPIRLRRLMREPRRRGVVLAALLVVAFATVAHHAAPTHAGMHMGPAVPLCVAVLAVGAFALAMAVRLQSLLPQPHTAVLPVVAQICPSPHAAAARAGPAHLQVLRL